MSDARIRCESCRSLTPSSLMEGALCVTCSNAQDDIVPGTPESVLSEAARLVDGDRQTAYGHPKDNHATTAKLWNAFLERRYNALHDRDGHVRIDTLIDARTVCWLNVLQKISRDAHTPGKDNVVDVAGFAANIGMLDDAS